MQVSFYNFSKKENSTARPSASALIATLDCSLKDGCSVVAPAVRVAWRATNMMPNYAYIPAWGRYYFITDIDYNASALVFSMAVDVLATYKTQIGASTQFVVRAASEKDEKIIDTLYPTQMLPMVVSSSSTNSIFDSTGCYVLGVAGGTSGHATAASTRGLSYYILDDSLMIAFANYANSWDGASDLMQSFQGVINATTDAMARQLMRVYEYVKTCFWIPLNINSVADTASLRRRIALGGFLCPLANGSGYEVNNFNITGTAASFTIPVHPDAATLGQWVNASPYSEHYIDVPFLGTVAVPVGMLTAGNTIRVDVDISILDGSTQFYIIGTSGGVDVMINRVETNIGVAVPINVIQSNLLGAAGSVIQGVASAVTGNFLGAGAGLANAVANVVPTPHTIGGLTGYHVSNYDSHMVSTFWRISDTDNTNHGSPLAARRQISTLSGYVQTEGAALALACTDNERVQVIGQMNAGFFYD